MEVMYLTDPVKTRMFSGEDKIEVFAKRLVYEFQSGRTDGYFISSRQEQEYKDWLSRLNEENVCYNTADRQYRKAIRYDSFDTLFLQVKSFEQSFQGCSGVITFEDESLQPVYDGWIKQRNERFAVLYRTWRDNRK